MRSTAQTCKHVQLKVPKEVVEVSECTLLIATSLHF